MHNLAQKLNLTPKRVKNELTIVTVNEALEALSKVRMCLESSRSWSFELDEILSIKEKFWSLYLSQTQNKNH